MLFPVSGVDTGPVGRHKISIKFSEEVMLLPDARDLYAQKHPVSRPRIGAWFLEKLEKTTSPRFPAIC